MTPAPPSLYVINVGPRAVSFSLPAEGSGVTRYIALIPNQPKKLPTWLLASPDFVARHGRGEFVISAERSGVPPLPLPPEDPDRVADILDASAVGRALLVAADGQAARTAIGAGTSSLVIGTTAGTAADGAVVDALGTTVGTIDTLLNAETTGLVARVAALEAAP